MTTPTVHLLALKKLIDSPVDEEWIEWADEMVLIGLDTEHVLELAGYQKPYNQFELAELTNRMFEELGFDLYDHDTLLKGCISAVLRDVIKDIIDLKKVLRVLRKLYMYLYFGSEEASNELGSKLSGQLVEQYDLQDFYNLSFALDAENDKLDTAYYYWRGTESSIKAESHKYFQEWLEKHGD